MSKRVFHSLSGFINPNDILVTREGKMLLSDYGSNSLIEINPTTRTMRKLLSKLSEPWGIDTTPAEDLLAITDRNNHRLVVFEQSGRIVRTISTGPQSCVEGLAFDSRNRIYTAEYNRGVVCVYSIEGDVLYEFGSELLSTPVGLAINSQDQLAVANPRRRHACLFDAPSGELLFEFGDGLLGTFNISVAFDSFGSIYFSNYSEKNLLVFSADGVLRESIDNFFSPQGIDVDSQNEIYVCEFGTGCIVSTIPLPHISSPID